MQLEQEELGVAAWDERSNSSLISAAGSGRASTEKLVNTVLIA